MKVIPDLMIHKIARDNPATEASAPHPSLAKNKETVEKMEAEEKKIHDASAQLKLSNPAAWEIYEDALLDLYFEAKQFQTQGFFHLITERVDPQYYTYTKIYAQSKIEVLESILSISQVPVLNLKKPISKKSNFIVDKIVKVLEILLRKLKGLS